MTSSGFMQGQLVQIYGMDSVNPMPAVIPPTIGRGAGPVTLPTGIPALGSGAAGAGSPSVENTGLPVWVWVLVFGIAAYILIWKVHYS